jgi:WD40 repeat protein
MDSLIVSRLLITGELIDRRIGIYSTDNWQRIAALRFGDDLSRRADAIDFSPDGKLLTIAYEDKRGGIDARIDLFSADTCKRIRSIKTFQELQNQSLTTAALTFSPDGSMIAIILIGAGAAWEYPNGQVAPRGVGCLTPTAVPESLHVFKVSDGSRVASVGGLGSGFEQHKFEWSPKNNFIEFLDVYEDTYFWDTLSHDPPQEKCQLPRSMTVVTFSPDGNLLSQGFADGVNLYELK